MFDNIVQYSEKLPTSNLFSHIFSHLKNPFKIVYFSVKTAFSSHGFGDCKIVRFLELTKRGLKSMYVLTTSLHLADAVDQSEQSIVTDDLSELSIESLR